MYYLLIDGFYGDICNYEIIVDEGINTEFSDYQQVQPGYIDGPTTLPCNSNVGQYTAVLPVCQAQNPETCSTPPPIDDCFLFEWTVPPGAFIIGDENAQTVTIDFTASAGGYVSVELLWDDNCGYGSCYCELCPTDPIPPLFVSLNSGNTVTLPPLEICENETFEFCGQTHLADMADTLYCHNSCDFFIQEIIVLEGASAQIMQTGDLGNDPFVLLENSFFEAGAPITYFWEGPGIGAATANDYTQEVNEPGTFTLTVTNTVSGCTAFAQTVVLPGSPCTISDNPAPPSDSCQTAPPFCESYLNGYCSVNAFFTPDDPGVLSCQIENNSWLSFVACTDTVQLEIAVSNCLQSEGLEISILQSIDCQTFTLYVDCQNIADGDTATVTATGLTVGGAYLLMVDGISADICQWEVLATMGVSDGGTFQEDNTPGEIIGPASACLTGPVNLNYTFTSPVCTLIPLGGCPMATQQICFPDPTALPCERDTVWHIEPPGIASFVNNDSTGANVEIFVSDTLNIPPGGVVTFTLFVDPFHVVPNPGDEPCEENCFVGCSN
ncbi:MAG TPA: hypothetical protein ENJ20_02395, partial [Bacteroidetes bacterium]|nr:hypothetical protein [Bacteroidota bacterium]